MATLADTSSITTGTYCKDNYTIDGFNRMTLQDMVITAVDSTTVTCTIGGSTVQTLTKDQALAYINAFGGYNP